MHQLYKLPKDYTFVYWSTPLEELSRIEGISNKKTLEWSLSLPYEERGNMDRMSTIMPSQFFVSLSLQVSHAMHLLITTQQISVDKISGVYLQRLTEIESGPDLLFVVGVEVGEEKYAMTPIDMKERINPQLAAVLLGSFEGEEEPVELLH